MYLEKSHMYEDKQSHLSLILLLKISTLYKNLNMSMLLLKVKIGTFLTTMHREPQKHVHFAQYNTGRDERTLVLSSFCYKFLMVCLRCPRSHY